MSSSLASRWLRRLQGGISLPPLLFELHLALLWTPQLGRLLSPRDRTRRQHFVPHPVPQLSWKKALEKVRALLDVGGGRAAWKGCARCRRRRCLQAHARHCAVPILRVQCQALPFPSRPGAAIGSTWQWRRCCARHGAHLAWAELHCARAPAPAATRPIAHRSDRLPAARPVHCCAGSLRMRVSRLLRTVRALGTASPWQPLLPHRVPASHPSLPPLAARPRCSTAGRGARPLGSSVARCCTTGCRPRLHCCGGTVSCWGRGLRLGGVGWGLRACIAELWRWH